MSLSEGMLFVELMKVGGGRLRCRDMTGNRPELRLGCFGKLAVERAKGNIESIGGGEPIAWYG
jgi:hypothetical protein